MRWARKEANVIDVYYVCKHAFFVLQKQFPFPLATAVLTGDYFYNRQLKANIFLSSITAPIF
jgi:hypothetical protein